MRYLLIFLILLACTPTKVINPPANVIVGSINSDDCKCDKDREFVELLHIDGSDLYVESGKSVWCGNMPQPFFYWERLYPNSKMVIKGKANIEFEKESQ